jgi:hypothetical protein
MSGAMLNVVWANSQQATTPMMMPNSRRSLPWNWGVSLDAETIFISSF